MRDIWEPVSGVFLKSQPLLPIPNWSIELWPLFTTIIGALAGAWLGAWAAQKIAKNEKNRDETAKEFRSINSAMIMSYNIANTSMVLKKQHLRDLKKSYDDDIEKYETLKKLPPPRRLDISPRLMTLGTITTPISTLQQVILEKISSNSSATNTVSALETAINNFNGSINRHNGLITQFQKAEYPQGYTFEHLYLGIPANGNVNNMYGDTLQALYTYNDDIIFFALKLHDDLRKLGLKVLPTYRKITKQYDSDIPDIDLTEPILQKLIPHLEDYEPWLSGFKIKQTSTPKSRWWSRRRCRDT